MTKAQNPMTKAQAPYDARARAFQFAAGMVRVVGTLPNSVVARELGRQLLRSGTSVGTNVEEADAAESRRDFVHKMSIARKEAQETSYWLRLLQVAWPEAEETTALLDEADQPIRILSASICNARQSEGAERHQDRARTAESSQSTDHRQRSIVRA